MENRSDVTKPEQINTIGDLFLNTVLDTTFYNGEDQYSDGDIEDDLLKIVKNHTESELIDVLLEDYRWPIVYHLSKLRWNITNTMNVTKEETVLEIGAGCGAVTGALACKADSVDCIELSKKRSTINAYRNIDFKNLKIYVGNFQDIQINKRYDVVTLIGVLEYGGLYIDSSRPFHDFLLKIKDYLKPSGRVYVAIENKLGLKYFAGAREDHLGTLFSGIEGYVQQNTIRTFTHAELENMSAECGYSTYFYYPFPDYKMPKMIFSDDFLPQTELGNPISNYDMERKILFDEAVAWQSIISGQEFKVFSNSFLVELKLHNEGKR